MEKTPNCEVMSTEPKADKPRAPSYGPAVHDNEKSKQTPPSMTARGGGAATKGLTFRKNG